MPDGRLKNSQYIVIQAPMIEALGLSGNELIVYAIIYGFSMDGESWYTGSIGYFLNWLGCSRKTVFNVLASLVSKEYIEKREVERNKVRFCDYRVSELSLNLMSGNELSSITRGVQKLHGGGVKITPHNLEHIDSIIGDTSIPDNRVGAKRFKAPEPDEVRAYCEERRNGINAEYFCDFYAARGWELSHGKKMKDWKAAVRTWERNARNDRTGNRTAIRREEEPKWL